MVKLGAGVGALVLAAALLIAGAATASHGFDGNAPSHVLTSGSASCPAGTNDAGSVKIPAGSLSGYSDDRVTITAASAGAFSWRLVNIVDFRVMAVIVKGGPNALMYNYGSDIWDNGLTPPPDPYPDGEPTAIEHVEFCFDPKDAPAPSLKVTKTASGTYDIGHSWTIAKQVKVAGAGDETYGENVVLSAPGSVTWKVTVTHAQTAKNLAVSGTITVENTSGTAVSGVAVSDSIPGATIDCGGGSSTGLTVPANGSLQCAYSAKPTTQVTSNTATATWGSTSASATAQIGWATGTETGGTATIADDGLVNATIGVGDLTGSTWSESYDEAWTCAKPGRVNEATVTWDGGTASDTASVTVACPTTPPTPPSPPPPAPPPPAPKTSESMDVQVVKDATARLQLQNGQATIVYTVRVRNDGPNQAHDVKLVDAAPGGVTFVAVTQQPANGSCSITGGVLLQCSLGTLGPGVERVIGFTGRVAQTGTFVNTAVATGQGGDRNGSNNTDSATTVVVAPLTPPVTSKPTPKPKPVKAKPNPCRVLKVAPSMVKATGTQQVVIAKVTRSKTPAKGVAVRFTGAGVTRSVRTNAQGVARLTVAPTKAGIIVARITNVKACNTARVGVIGVFEPPVTG